ncbi:unnamed protein product, partial [Rotaria sp. Silwood2]
MENKSDDNELFNRLSTAGLNQYLSELMEGLTAKVLKILAYNRANRQVALPYDHQRCVPKTLEKSIGTVKAKIDAKISEIDEQKSEYKTAKTEYKNTKSHASQKNGTRVWMW